MLTVVPAPICEWALPLSSILTTANQIFYLPINSIELQCVQLIINSFIQKLSASFHTCLALNKWWRRERNKWFLSLNLTSYWTWHYPVYLHVINLLIMHNFILKVFSNTMDKTNKTKIERTRKYKINVTWKFTTFFLLLI